MTPILLILWAVLPSTDAPEPRERIDAISLSADAKAGVVITHSEFLDGGQRHYGFGEGKCKGQSVDPAALERLFEAMHRKSFIRVDATKIDKTECLRRGAFFAES